MGTAPFWMVHATGGGAPTYRHDSFDAARAEAERLARCNPGTAFVVLESVEVAIKHDVEIRSLRPGRAREPHAGPTDIDDDLPF